MTCDPSIKTVADLCRQKNVSVGAARIGCVLQRRRRFEGVRLRPLDDINPVYQSFADSADSMKDNKIDAAFIVAGAPTTAITDLSTTKTAYLVSMDDEHVAKLLRGFPVLPKAVIPADVYGLEADVTTVSVGAVVIANDNLSEEAILRSDQVHLRGC